MQLDEIRDWLSDMVRKHDYWMLPLLKALTALLLLFLAAKRYTPGISGLALFIMLFLAVLASVLPWAAISAELGIIILYLLYKSTLELFLAAAVFFLFVTLVQSAFRSRYGLLIALVPLCFLLHLPYLAPMIAGLSLGMAAAVPIALGTMCYYFLELLALRLGSDGAGADVEAIANLYGDMFLEYIGRNELILMLTVLLLCFAFVYAVRLLPFDYSWYIATGTGAALGFAVLALGAHFLKADISLGGELLSLFISLFIALAYILLVHDADYRRTEKLQFEDDSYFYYVKAVPKRRTR